MFSSQKLQFHNITFSRGLTLTMMMIFFSPSSRHSLNLCGGLRKPLHKYNTFRACYLAQMALELFRTFRLRLIFRDLKKPLKSSFETTRIILKILNFSPINQAQSIGHHGKILFMNMHKKVTPIEALSIVQLNQLDALEP